MKLPDTLLEKVPSDALDLFGVKHGNGLVRDAYDPQSVLFMLGRNDPYRLMQAYQGGIHVLGGPGSGKSRAVIRTIATSLMNLEGLGGIWSCVKPEERKAALSYAEECGASDRVYVISENNPWRINLSDYLFKMHHEDVEIVVEFFSNAAEAMARYKGHAPDPFWREKARSLVRNTLALLSLAQKDGEETNLGFETMYQALHAAPKQEAQVADPAWREGSYWYQLMLQGDGKSFNPRDQNDWDKTKDFWWEDFLLQPDKLRESVLSTLNVMLEGLTRGVFAELFCTTTNITPEITFLEAEDYRDFCAENGFECRITHQSGSGLVICDFPEKTYMELGLAVQNMWRYIWQRRMEARMADTSRRHRPAFSVCDEGHFLITEYDYKFASTSRSALAVQIWASQSYDNYLAKLGEQARSQINAFLQEFQTHIFLNNASIGQTNELASTLIGKHWAPLAHSGTVGGAQTTGVSWQLIDKIEKTEFGMLKRPSFSSPTAEAVVYQNGAEFKGNYCRSCRRHENWMRCTFSVA